MLKDANGQWIEDVNQLQKLANEFYIKLFIEDNLVREWHQTPISYPLLTQDELQQLAAPITQEEVRSAVFNMHPWKAPGPDGFPAGFYQKSWDVVGENVRKFVEKVWSEPSALSEVNHTDICLIPKVSQPDHIRQFRPISLCNTNYKIVSKVVVARLKKCIPKSVSPWFIACIWPEEVKGILHI
jgi:hypothetical protein